MSAKRTSISPKAFLQTLFPSALTGNIYLCRLPNIQGSEPPKDAIFRLPEDAVAFTRWWDEPGAAIYFCVSTIDGCYRNKSSAFELPFINLDLDLDADPKRIEQAEAVLEACAYPPNIIVHSGSGVHAYWLLKPHDWPKDSVDSVRKGVARLFNGDQQVTHCAALMRMPGSHNSKRSGEPKLVVAYALHRNRYDAEALYNWSRSAEPLLAGKPMTDRERMLARFAAVGASASKEPIDVKERLNTMSYQADGEHGVHITQRDVSASLISRGYDLEEVVKIVLFATRKAVGKRKWDWVREEREIRKMAVAWMRKKAELDLRNNNLRRGK